MSRVTNRIGSITSLTSRWRRGDCSIAATPAAIALPARPMLPPTLWPRRELGYRRPIARMGPGKGRPAAGRRVKQRPGRYTPPTPRHDRLSPRWVPAFMITALICGVVIVMVGYFGFESGSGTQILSMLVGGAFVTAGLAAAMTYR